jgi:hypothetical protein
MRQGETRRRETRDETRRREMRDETRRRETRGEERDKVRDKARSATLTVAWLVWERLELRIFQMELGYKGHNKGC